MLEFMKQGASYQWPHSQTIAHTLFCTEKQHQIKTLKNKKDVVGREDQKEKLNISSETKR